LLADKQPTAPTSAFASLLPNQKAGANAAQTAAVLTENADLALQNAAASGQSTAHAAAKATAQEVSALQMATTAQAAATPGSETADEPLRPKLEVTSTSPTPTPSGIGPGTTVNTAQVSEASARSAEATPIQQIAERVQVTLDQGENSATIRLQPEELGSVRIRLQVQDGQLHLSIHAEKAQTSRLLDQQLGDLRQTLESGGIKVGDLAVLAGSRTQVAGSEALSREAAQVLRTLNMEMGGNSTQQQHQQQQQAAFGQGNYPKQDQQPHYGQQPMQEGQKGFAIPIAGTAGATDAWGWRSAPRGVDYYA
jgi:flagellar hook-length control protein FliK